MGLRNDPMTYFGRIINTALMAYARILFYERTFETTMDTSEFYQIW